MCLILEDYFFLFMKLSIYVYSLLRDKNRTHKTQLCLKVGKTGTSLAIIVIDKKLSSKRRCKTLANPKERHLYTVYHLSVAHIHLDMPYVSRVYNSNTVYLLRF